MGVALDQNKKLNLIRLEGEVDIGMAAELKQLLLQALGSGKEMRVSVQSATSVDVTALQLLWAAEREARGSGVAFTLAGEIPKPVSDSLISAGFQKFPVSADAK